VDVGLDARTFSLAVSTRSIGLAGVIMAADSFGIWSRDVRAGQLTRHSDRERARLRVEEFVLHRAVSTLGRC
jgi:hypothetical protein